MTQSFCLLSARTFDQELGYDESLSVSVRVLSLVLSTILATIYVLFYYATLHLLSAAIPHVKLCGPYGIASLKRPV